ncbi:MAG: hypothetical protein C4523_21455 [Myxococcales bacterium]|nr:MAG: hypothetical protein C4523_21455 [Myxococcales bacterium]
MSITNKSHAVFFMLAVLLLLAACGENSKDKELTPPELCRQDIDAQCCAQEDCNTGELCDFTYICSPAPDDEIICSDGSGSRTCLATCDDEASCAEGEVCLEQEFFFGSDAGEARKVCLMSCDAATTCREPLSCQETEILSGPQVGEKAKVCR